MPYCYTCTPPYFSAMSDSLWAPSSASSAPAPGILDGGAMEAVMRRSLEDNPYSMQGFWLWQARFVQQRHHRDLGRRRPRGEAWQPPRNEEAAAVAEQGPRNQAEATAVQHAEEVKSYISALLHATGYPYLPIPDPERAAERLEDAVLADTAEREKATATSQTVAPQVDAAPLKAARIEESFTAAPPSSSPAPKSALAKLVAKAKAQHRDGAGDTPAVTVVPAPKRPPFPEDIPGMRLAQGSSYPASSLSAGRKKTVQFADEAERGSDEEDFSVQLPGHVAPGSSTQTGNDEGSDNRALTAGATPGDEAAAAKHPSQMTRAEFLSQFKRAPRRGEIGQTAEDIANAEKLGYVMSGSRSVASRMYVDRIQRQLHEHEAAKLQQQFRKVEDERMDDQLVRGLASFVMKKKDNLN